ncbi:MAG: PD40 domain-containing protein [Dechloromonas sp.]|nr:MAG: PD40 domain-containing protein [Dechloromonas sp.]
MSMRLLSSLSARTAVWVFLAILNSACSTGAGVSTTIDIESPAFSPDGKTLLFDFCKGSQCDLVAYSLEEQQFSRIVPVEEGFRFSSASMANHPNLLAGGALPEGGVHRLSSNRPYRSGFQYLSSANQRSEP